uniref:Uncharacterized protein n=1 Tax=Anguilla anguilla TaxID=7936 RepID=A0A0E9PY30_ANGAN
MIYKPKNTRHNPEKLCNCGLVCVESMPHRFISS